MGSLARQSRKISGHYLPTSPAATSDLCLYRPFNTNGIDSSHDVHFVKQAQEPSRFADPPSWSDEEPPSLASTSHVNIKLDHVCFAGGIISR